jgi:hypothetical protein
LHGATPTAAVHSYSNTLDDDKEEVEEEEQEEQ